MTAVLERPSIAYDDGGDQPPIDPTEEPWTGGENHRITYYAVPRTIAALRFTLRALGISRGVVERIMRRLPKCNRNLDAITNRALEFHAPLIEAAARGQKIVLHHSDGRREVVDLY